MPAVGVDQPVIADHAITYSCRHFMAAWRCGAARRRPRL